MAADDTADSLVAELLGALARTRFRWLVTERRRLAFYAAQQLANDLKLYGAEPSKKPGMMLRVKTEQEDGKLPREGDPPAHVKEVERINFETSHPGSAQHLELLLAFVNASEPTELWSTAAAAHEALPDNEFIPLMLAARAEFDVSSDTAEAWYRDTVPELPDDREDEGALLPNATARMALVAMMSCGSGEALDRHVDSLSQYGIGYLLGDGSNAGIYCVIADYVLTMQPTGTVDLAFEVTTCATKTAHAASMALALTHVHCGACLGKYGAGGPYQEALSHAAIEVNNVGNDPLQCAALDARRLMIRMAFGSAKERRARAAWCIKEFSGCETDGRFEEEFVVYAMVLALLELGMAGAAQELWDHYSDIDELNELWDRTQQRDDLDSSEDYFVRGMLDMAAGRHEKAEDKFAWACDGWTAYIPAVYWHRGVNLHRWGRSEDALRQFSAAVKQTPGIVQEEFSIYEAALRAAGRGNGAVKRARTAVENCSVGGATAAKKQQKAARALMNSGRSLSLSIGGVEVSVPPELVREHLSKHLKHLSS